MNLSRSSHEILAPAGNPTCLTAAIQAGAQAVYFGVDSFNMRAAAQNFTRSDMAKVTHLCHDAGVRAYLVLNTIVYENELDDLERVLEQASQARADAVIAWDFAVIQAARRHGLHVMLSTQGSVSNSAAIRFYHDTLGVRRMVLARECTLEQITTIREELDQAGLQQIELEAFAHGAMCLAISGRCLMSYEHSGKSANRGECLQPCRREYKVTEPGRGTEFQIGRDYVLSPQDLCTLPFLDQLVRAGIHSFKIEGRNRSPEYVATTTRAYRRVLDACLEMATEPSTDARQAYEAIVDEEMENLGKVYHRGFSNGFYFGKPLDAWAKQAGSAATHTKQHLGKVLNYYDKPSVAHIRVENGEVHEGDTVLIQGPTTGSLAFTAQDIRIEDTPADDTQSVNEITLRVPGKVRRGDRVFLQIQR